MSKNKTQETPITIICWKCDRKFKILLSTVKKEIVVYLGEDDVELGTKPIMPKTYVVPCPDPDCGAENEVTLP